MLRGVDPARGARSPLCAAAVTMGTRAPALPASGSITSSGCLALICSPLPWGQPPDQGTGLPVTAGTGSRGRWRRSTRVTPMHHLGGSACQCPCCRLPLCRIIPCQALGEVGHAQGMMALLCGQPTWQARGRAPCSTGLVPRPLAKLLHPSRQPGCDIPKSISQSAIPPCNRAARRHPPPHEHHSTTTGHALRQCPDLRLRGLFFLRTSRHQPPAEILVE